MKFFKFLQIFALVCCFYIFAYITYSLFSMAKYVDYYCIPASIFLLFATYWLAVGVTFPQNLPFFKMQSRLLVAIIALLSAFALFGILIAVEVYFYKRPALQNIILNGYKVFEIARTIDPLDQRFKKIN